MREYLQCLISYYLHQNGLETAKIHNIKIIPQCKDKPNLSGLSVRFLKNVPENHGALAYGPWYSFGYFESARA